MMNKNVISELPSMREFVLHIRNMTTTELCSTYPETFAVPVWMGNQNKIVKEMLALDAKKWIVVGEFAKFLSRLIRPYMLVPCDRQGNVLNDPGLIPSAALLEFRHAKSRVLFEGFEFTKNHIINPISGAPIFEKTNTGWVLSDDCEETIEDLVPYRLTITLTALKEMGL